MYTFGRWLVAVIRHYWFVLGGTTLGVVGLWVQQYAPNGKLPPWVFYVLCGVSFVGAVFLTWREEWDRANALAIVRPEFAHSYAGLEQLKKTDGTLLDRYDVRFS